MMPLWLTLHLNDLFVRTDVPAARRPQSESVSAIVLHHLGVKHSLKRYSQKVQS